MRKLLANVEAGERAVLEMRVVVERIKAREVPEDVSSLENLIANFGRKI